MVKIEESLCPVCGAELIYYDTVKRIVRLKEGNKDYIYIRRLKCPKCGRIHREIPDKILPYKHYDAEIIKGVLNGFIFSDTLGFEDYPCELTMIRWRISKSQGVL